MSEAESQSGREKQIDAARDCFYRGFIAEEIAAFLETAEVMDGSGTKHKGVLTADDLATWSATYEDPLLSDYHDWTVAKTGPWGQGPVLLQALALLKGFDIGAMDPAGADFVHHVTEAMKLAYADREVYYGDPAFVDVPMSTLLSDDYNNARRKLISDTASFDLRPGVLPGFEDQVAANMAVIERAGIANTVYTNRRWRIFPSGGVTRFISTLSTAGATWLPRPRPAVGCNPLRLFPRSASV